MFGLICGKGKVLADRKITELANITGANLADADEFVVVDASADETKAITFAELKSGLDTATGFVRITGDTMTGNLDIQGTLTSDDVTVQQSAFTKALIGSTGANGAMLVLDGDSNGDGSGGDYSYIYHNTSGQLEFLQDSPSGTNEMLFNTAGNNLRMKIGSGGDISFYEDTGTTAKFFWDASAENITINHEASSLNGLAIKNDTSTGITTGAGLTLHAHDGTSVNQIGGIFVSNSTWNYGTYSPKQLSITGSNSGGVRVATVVAPITFHTGNSNAGLSTERMRIDSSGNLLVGHTTVDSFTNVGHQLDADGYAIHTRTSAPALYVGRKTTDGSIMEFNKDGTTVGSIGVTAGGVDTYIGKGTTGLRFYDGSNTDGGTGIIVPWNTSTNAARDAQMNLGSSSERYRNLYLSGVAYASYVGSSSDTDTSIAFDTSNTIRLSTGGLERLRILSSGGITFNGDTAAANALDDYEEGTFTTTLIPASGSITLSTTDDLVSYTKIGNQVFVTGRIIISSVSSPSGSEFYITNLPFTIKTPSEQETGGAGSTTYYDSSLGAYLSTQVANIDGSTAGQATRWRFFKDCSTMAANDQISFTFCYITT